MPFRTTVRDSLGEETVKVTEVRFNEQIPAAAFLTPAGVF